MRSGKRFSHFFLLPVVCVALAACGSGGGDDDDTPALDVKFLSSRADFVSGGDGLVEVILPTGTAVSGLRVEVGGRDVSSAFALRANGRVTGVVSGLANGVNTLVVSAPGVRSASLKITNHPIGGPILSGQQIQPWVCATPTAQPEAGSTPSTNGSGLATSATDAQCNIATETRFFYKTTTAACVNALPDPTPPATANPNNCFKPYDPNAVLPADLATTTTDTGLTVPYIVRRERGTINRGIYDIAVLFDPAKPWTATAPQSAWNGKLLYQFGGSTGQPRKQFRPQGSWADDKSLARGYMVVQNSLTDSQYNANRVLMSETVMMMKEHVTDTYGEIRFTMGAGCSGGSINQNTAASIMPGLLDGIQPTCTYPDSETTTMEVQDCVLLVEAYQKPDWLNLMANGGYSLAQVNAKKAAINGHLDQTACHAWNNLFGTNSKPGNFFARVVLPADNATGVITTLPVSANNCQLPANTVYDPVTNPNGPRCGGADSAVAVWGKVPNTVFARDTRDNVGVQYGLKAFIEGAITAEEFVTLNEIIGGVNADSILSVNRSQANPDALATAYRAGIVASGKLLAQTPIIDMRGWDDSLIAVLPSGISGPPNITGIHHVWRSFALRDRLDKANGSHAGHVMWRYARNGFVPAPSMTLDAFQTMDMWLTNLKADTSTASIAQKVVRAKPVEAFDFCYLSGDAAQATKVTDKAICDADPFLRPHASPRQTAGGPRSEDILKCQLRPLNAADYAPQIISGIHLARLQAVFPDGVCDWLKPGVGQQAPASSMTFSGGAGGVPIGPAPTATPQ
ncbi:hypothetical protein D3870_08895 [Noviherbaspirillum cavernae]|uniref:DUF6351 domain-containing protein n=1 Tax=Noviherbaspirillum cavernae TaxID=2320862 RepID=A0A418X0U3_9BURK|nr:DUF6351 family protein [Noviherbaspirillum cavernae]RJG06106.1 hypothetical protein D3870_08895 [Noviherbaspirillum cavernae]